MDLHRLPPVLPHGAGPTGLRPRGSRTLISTTGEAVIVHTGIANGNVAVHIETHDHEPPMDDADWEEVTEASMQVEEGPLMVRCLMEDPPDLPMLTPAGLASTGSVYTLVAATSHTTVACRGHKRSISSSSGRLPTCRCMCSNRPICAARACAALHTSTRSSYSRNARSSFQPTRDPLATRR
ncbi:hypothetical protein ACTIVE_1693 [Actinomadura verrucosospora]|uniref:Uncharacterized protein n=1 Tax=Actinomadura verrucosospora TaxID=46165 RepID=A0A7D3ZDD5_ACTVE|nr:hypothetical protein ACTIVE_1693 [Actinomadura verrucosospora]